MSKATEELKLWVDHYGGPVLIAAQAVLAELEQAQTRLAWFDSHNPADLIDVQEAVIQKLGLVSKFIHCDEVLEDGSICNCPMQELGEGIGLSCPVCNLRDKLAETRKELEQAQVRLDSSGCCFAGPGRGDCEHFVGLPGKSLPDQHDGPDDTVDCYGKPNGWCWSCWKSYRLKNAEAQLDILRKAESDGQKTILDLIDKLRTAEADRDRYLSALNQLSPVARESILKP